MRWGAPARPPTACSHTAASSSPIPGPIATVVLGEGKPPGGAEVAKASSCPWQQGSGSWQELHLCPAGLGREAVIAHSRKRSRRAFPFLCDVTDLHVFSLDAIISRVESFSPVSRFPALPCLPRHSHLRAMQPRKRHMSMHEADAAGKDVREMEAAGGKYGASCLQDLTGHSCDRTTAFTSAALKFKGDF